MLVLRHVDAQDRVVIIAGIDDFTVRVVEVLFFQIVDLDAFDRRDNVHQ